MVADAEWLHGLNNSASFNSVVSSNHSDERERDEKDDLPSAPSPTPSQLMGAVGKAMRAVRLANSISSKKLGTSVMSIPSYFK